MPWPNQKLTSPISVAKKPKPVSYTHLDVYKRQTPEGNLTLVDDYHTNYSDGSGQQFITLVSKSGATFYLVIDRNRCV